MTESPKKCDITPLKTILLNHFSYIHIISVLILILTRLISHRGSNIIENMVTMMEKHANHLEQLVEERTRQLNEEKDKTEKILYRLLPP